MPSDSTPRPIIHWFRRDLRVADNTSLCQAAAAGHPVVPVYIPSSWRREHNWTGPNRQAFLCGCLESLAGNLTTIGGELIIRHGDPVDALTALAGESRAVAIHCNADPDPHGRAVESRLRTACQKLGIALHVHHDHTMHRPDEVLTGSGQPYRVYTPYSRNWLSLAKSTPLGKPRDLATPGGIRSEPLPTLDHWKLPSPAASIVTAGEKAARNRLRQAVAERLARYAALRDTPSVAGTSRLSQDLRHGTLSIRTIYAAAIDARESASPGARKGIDTFIKELAWREFYFAILHHYPDVLDWEFNPDWRGLPWNDAGPGYDAWRAGLTGFPLVDAAMRELLATGHMHNRTRMITAMFLTKDLRIHWKLGESHFMQHLVDGEIASNNGGWQWSAGTGADAAPWFRIQNPWLQSARHDPDGIYIKRWLPELARVPARLLHSPPPQPLVPGYPAPIVEHAQERERTLAFFKSHRPATH